MRGVCRGKIQQPASRVLLRLRRSPGLREQGSRGEERLHFLWTRNLRCRQHLRLLLRGTIQRWRYELLRKLRSSLRLCQFSDRKQSVHVLRSWKVCEEQQRSLRVVQRGCVFSRRDINMHDVRCRRLQRGRCVELSHLRRGRSRERLQIGMCCL